MTVRVPRIFLQKTARAEICERRFLWGADVYTDDSDPIAVAIHSGWLRGEWNKDIDLSMFNLEGLENAKAKASELAQSNERVLNILELPSAPMLPVAGRDLHITLLILPRLERYGSLTAHGIKSREWKSKHDGVSFNIEKIAWVDEGLSRGEERGGEARRKRLRVFMESYREIGVGCKISNKISNDSDTPVKSILSEPSRD